jgi:hypothetical protein
LEAFEQDILRNDYRGVRERSPVRRIAPYDTTPFNTRQTGKKSRLSEDVPNQCDRGIAEHDGGNAGPILPLDGNPKTGVPQKMRTAISRNTTAANSDTPGSGATWIVTFQEIL